ncbi:unnamed protein product [Dicrocoelium dendriticum]|nr:unnamed protein product [Dicrocoelium dendriticum]
MNLSANYRPISLTSVVVTLLETLVKDSLYQLNVLLDFKPRNWAKGPPVREAELRQVFYGRFVASSKRKVFMNSYRLADRSYLGNTSMDVRLAAIMANVGLCGPGALVWDPFVGTGSILLAASLWGAFGAGSDIDFALLHGLGMSPKAGQGKRINGECLRTNYAQYGIRSLYLDVIVADAASLHRLLRVPGVDNFVKPTAAAKCIGLVDAVLTDPPYGFRESSRRIAVHAIERAPGLVTVRRLADITGSDSPCGRCVDDQTLVEVPHDLPHFPHKEEYPLHEANSDLLALSSRLLRPGGRLVFWVPVNRANPIGPDTLPRHPDLQLLAVCEQILNSRNSRYMVAMRKRGPNDLGSSDAPASEKFHLAELFPP